MSNENSIRILEYKIEELEVKIANFIKHEISDKKRERLEMMKLKYETQLEEILAG